MENVQKLLNAVKQNKGIESDYALAKILDLPAPRIHDYYKGKAAPDEFACLQIAQALAIPLDAVIATVRMDTEKNEKRRLAWESYYKGMGGIAA